MAYLRIFMGGKLLEQRELSANVTTIGRTEDNDIVLSDSRISKHHATIKKQGDGFILVDNDSANGVFVKGKKIDQHKLRYWDEIQIYNYVLTFMAVARLKGEEAGMPTDQSDTPAQDLTMEVDISSLGDLARLKKRINIPALSLPDIKGREQRYTLDKVNFRIGRGGDCDIALGGWFAPSLAAQIQRRSDGCYIIPTWRGRVSLNGQRIQEPSKLADGDDLRVRGRPMTFYLRPLDDG